MSLTREQADERLASSILSRRAALALVCLASVAIAGAGVGLWRYFGAGGLASYSERAVVFGDSDLRLPPELAGETGRIRVVHFWDPDCTTCNKETDAHLNYLIQMYRNANVDFYSVQKPNTRGQLAPFLQGKLKPLPRIEGMERLPASPSMAIWAANGKLAYAGPYSEGLVCSSANSFVEPVLDKLIAGQQVEPMAMMAIGCYCLWNTGPGTGG
ncbi:hypothetical protein SAMN05216345_12415 [Cupriavidus sp. YR651]|uniref:DUF6436 domain-containing protein n=1 Tax=Cupriavidus sp. YR651 TaxID=1855315 RepID=UPI000885AA9D|nr:DUF6436 domain-containing protein [Cupriavidus sp. YR651]SDD96092.1 hypothetical protein SAMN05216345_12415 [Cupriavidus sp. YR651]